jgi:hypothetical protein
MVENKQRSVKLLAVPLHGRLPRAGGLPATGEAAGELAVGAELHGHTRRRLSSGDSWTGNFGVRVAKRERDRKRV